MKRLLVFAAFFVTAVAVAQDNVRPQGVFDGMQKSFRPDRASGVTARYQFDLSGPEGGHWRIEVKDNTCRIERGEIERPDVTFVASDKDWVALSNGKLSGTWATITARLKVHGNYRLARKLEELFP